MSTSRRAAILKMASAAYEMDQEVLRGVLRQDESGGWLLGNQSLNDWLAGFQGRELVLILGALDDLRELAPRTCLTCGRDYTGPECPHCRANRLRLRGRA